MMSRVAAFFRQRGRALGLAFGLGLLVQFRGSGPPERSLAGLTEMLGQACRGAVEPDSIIWEQSPGFVWEALFGRRVLFLAGEKSGAPRDVYRARVRLARDGSPISASEVYNLTSTPHGDDVALEASGSRAVFATMAFGRVQALSILETQGIRYVDRPTDVLGRWLLALTSLRESGSTRGVGRTDIVLDVPTQYAELRLESNRLSIDFAERGRALVFDLEERLLRGADGGEPYAARVVPRAYGNKPLLLWTVDAVRAEVGPEPIAWLERVVFGARDSWRRTSYALFAGAESSELSANVEQMRARVLDAKTPTASEQTWPPPPIPSFWKATHAGEGKWKPVTYGFLKSMPGIVPEAGPIPPYFYTTFIRPDRARPYSKVFLIALDMRQLELGMQAGWEDPKPTTGPTGGGRLPRDPEVYRRVVATFNGAFKTTHGEYGMMVNRRVLLPPVKGGATVIVNQQGEVGLGSWPQTVEIPPEIVSYRQNLDPLVEDGVANPTGRLRWGWQLEGTSVMTQRTALCVTKGSHLYYAFAPEIDGKTLGKALEQAGCSYAIHLDMNPGHCGFVYTDVRDPKAGDMTLKLAHDEMKIVADKYARWSSKDFFYVMVREATPQTEGIEWVADSGVQPPPAWLPGITRGVLKIGSLEVELTQVEKGRIDYTLRAGKLEPGNNPRAADPLDEAETSRVIGAVGLGHATDRTRPGLAYATEQILALDPEYATLILENGQPRLEPPGRLESALVDGHQAVQLPLLVRDSKVLEHARRRGDLQQRTAFCVTPEGRGLFAQARHDSSDALAAALLKLGCSDVLELNRGSHHPGFFHRAGTSTPPMQSYEASALYLLARPMIPRAFRWKPVGSIPSTKVTSGDGAPKEPKPSSNPRTNRFLRLLEATKQ